MPRSKPSPEPTSPVVVILLCAVTTVTAAAFAVPLMVSGLSWKERTEPLPDGVSTEGRVVRVITDDKTYRAVVEYADAQGTTHQVTNKAGNDEPTVGDDVEISYDPADPSRAHDLTTGQGTWKLPFMTGAFMIGFSVLVDATVVIVVWRERRKKQDAEVSTIEAT